MVIGMKTMTENKAVTEPKLTLDELIKKEKKSLSFWEGIRAFASGAVEKSANIIEDLEKLKAAQEG